MKFRDVFQQFEGQGFFAFNQVLAVTNERRATLRQQLYRWVKKGQVIPLKRGIYAFPRKMTKAPLNAERTANMLHGHKSYVTALWQMNRLGLFPEGLGTVISVTTGATVEFETPLGRYAYYHIEPRGFFGYETQHDRHGQPMLVACAEKAVLDFFWLKKIEWNEMEFQRWRIEDPWEILDHAKIENMARQWGRPRLLRAAGNFTTYLKQQKAKTTWI